MNELTREKIEEYYQTIETYNEDMKQTTWYIPIFAEQPDFFIYPFNKPSEILEWAIQMDVGFQKGTFSNGNDRFDMRGLLKMFYKGLDMKVGDMNNDNDYDMISKNKYRREYEELFPKERVDIIQTINKIDKIQADCFRDYMVYLKENNL